MEAEVGAESSASLIEQSILLGTCDTSAKSEICTGSPLISEWSLRCWRKVSMEVLSLGVDILQSKKITSLVTLLISLLQFSTFPYFSMVPSV